MSEARWKQQHGRWFVYGPTSLLRMAHETGEPIEVRRSSTGSIDNVVLEHVTGPDNYACSYGWPVGTAAVTGRTINVRPKPASTPVEPMKRAKRTGQRRAHRAGGHSR